MVLAHHLYDVVKKHRASRSPLVGSHDVEHEPSQELDDVARVCDDLKEVSVDAETLRSMFEARDIALNKLISSTTATATATAAQTCETMKSESVSSPLGGEEGEEAAVKESNVESLECPSCQETISCSFRPLRSAVAAHRRSQLDPVSSSTISAAELEPKHTNWTTDFFGYSNNNNPLPPLHYLISFALSTSASLPLPLRTLDYLFISTECSVESAQVYPFSDANAQTAHLPNGERVDGLSRSPLPIPASNGPYPNALWPSDHSLLDVTVRY